MLAIEKIEKIVEPPSDHSCWFLTGPGVDWHDVQLRLANYYNAFLNFYISSGKKNDSYVVGKTGQRR